MYLTDRRHRFEIKSESTKEENTRLADSWIISAVSYVFGVVSCVDRDVSYCTCDTVTYDCSRLALQLIWHQNMAQWVLTLRFCSSSLSWLVFVVWRFCCVAGQVDWEELFLCTKPSKLCCIKGKKLCVEARYLSPCWSVYVWMFLVIWFLF